MFCWIFIFRLINLIASWNVAKTDILISQNRVYECIDFNFSFSRTRCSCCMVRLTGMVNVLAAFVFAFFRKLIKATMKVRNRSKHISNLSTNVKYFGLYHDVSRFGCFLLRVKFEKHFCNFLKLSNFDCRIY